MGLCCCKDWRGHLRAPKGNSWACTCAADSGLMRSGEGRAPPVPSCSLWKLPVPPRGFVRRIPLGHPTPASAVERAQMWLQLPPGDRTLERASRVSFCSAESGWRLGSGPRVGGEPRGGESPPYGVRRGR